jgi:hypothetical protein
MLDNEKKVDVQQESPRRVFAERNGKDTRQTSVPFFPSRCDLFSKCGIMLQCGMRQIEAVDGI